MNSKILLKVKAIDKYSFILFSFILGLMGGWAGQLLPATMVRLFDKNRTAQLVVLFCLILFTLNLVEKDLNNYQVYKKVLKSVLILVIYIIISKQSQYSFIFVFFLLSLQSLVNSSKNQIENLLNSNEKIDNKVEVEKDLEFYTNLLNIIDKILVISVLYGFTKYFKKQYDIHRLKSKTFFEFFFKFMFEGSMEQQEAISKVIPDM